MTGSIQVLHVDDEPGFAALSAKFLERESERIAVETEASATAALEAVRGREPDCIVADHDMPEMNGIELLEAVRVDYPDVPFILFTGKGSEAVASDAVSAGVTDYLQKEQSTEQYTLLANRIENVVEQYRSQQAVEQQKRRLETLISNLPGIVYRCRNEPDWPMEEVAGECEQLSGYSATALESGPLSWGTDVVHPDDQGKVWADVQAALDSGDPFECTYRIRTAAGETKWVWERGRRVSTADGDQTALEGFITDVSETKRRLRRFEAIFNNTFQCTGLLEPDGTIIEANEPLLSFADLDRSDVVGTPLWDATWFAASDRAKAIAREAVETARDGTLFREEIRVRGSDRDVFVDFSVRPVPNEDGAITELVLEWRDISAVKAREKQLRAYERRFEAILDDPNLLVGLLDTEGTVTEVNETALEYVDVSRQSIIGQPFWDTPWWTDDDRAAVEGWVATAAAGTYVEYEATHPAADGTQRTVEGSFRPVTDGRGDVVRIVVSAKDVTAQRRQESALKRHSERFDEFASFVSHDLQSPISTVRGRLALALETGEMEHVETAAAAIERVDDLRSDLVATLRTGEIVSETDPVDLAPVLEAVWTAVDPPETVSYTVDDTARVEADVDALQRLFENLVGNSVEHGPDDVAIRVGALDAGFYYEDSGPGIDPALRERVFTPGFSTKNGTEGIGMGLASVRQIVLAHGWTIGVDDATLLDGVRFEIVAE